MKVEILLNRMAVTAQLSRFIDFVLLMRQRTVTAHISPNLWKQFSNRLSAKVHGSNTN